MNLINWDELPVVRILLPFIIGILLGIRFNLPATGTLLMLAGLWLVILMLFNWKKWKSDFVYQWVYGFLLFFLILFISFERTNQKKDINHPRHFAHFLTDTSYVMLRLNEPLIEKFRSFKAEVSVLEIRNGTDQRSVFGKALVYFEKDSLVQNLKYGDWIWCKSSLKTIKPPQNPGEFDYKTYLSHRQIYHQAYLEAKDLLELNINTGNYIFTFVYRLRAYFIEVIKTFLKGNDEKSVAMALFLGYTHFLPDDIEETYSHTGTIHVLAVSGLHVGIIYLTANWILSLFFKRGRWTIRVKAALVLLIIWFYAMLAGLPPSVTRAAGMFTIFTIAKVFYRQTNSYNIIGFAALITLFLNPFTLTNIGFQLSYIAVSGIIFFQPKFYQALKIKNKILDKIWQISSVTLAAQVVVTPLTMYYFHQFPTYFLLANLLVVPVTGYLLPLGFLLFLISPVEPVAKVLGAILDWTLKLINSYLYEVQHLPFAVIQGFSISMEETVALYVIIGMITCTVLMRQIQIVKLILFLFLVLGLGWAYQNYQMQKNKEIIVYQYKGASALELVYGNHSVVISDSLGLDELFASSKRSHIIRERKFLPILRQNNQPEIQYAQPFPQNLLIDPPFLKFFDKRFLLLSDSTDHCNFSTGSLPLKIDYLILTHNCRAELNELKNCFEIDMIIIDGSNKGWVAKKWMSAADSLSLDIYNTFEKGAFVYKFP